MKDFGAKIQGDVFKYKEGNQKIRFFLETDKIEDFKEKFKPYSVHPIEM